MRPLTASLACLLFSSTPLLADSFVIVGTGGSIPAAGGGGGGVWQSTLPPTPFVSSISVPHPVIEITRIDLTGLVHPWAGDLHAVLRDPDGTMYNLFVRSGSSNGNFGNNGDFNGTYTFFNAVNGNGSDFPGSGDIAPGNYRQDFGQSGSLPTPWVSGTANVFNTPINDVVAPAGTWSLVIYDWGVGDVGTLTGWKLYGVDDFPPIAPNCFGDGTQSTPCPCGNSGAAGRGCNNSNNTGGSLLTGSGAVNPDSVVLTAVGEPPHALSIFLQSGSTTGNGFAFGDGLRCFAAVTKRLYVKSAPAGTVSAPTGAEPSITSRSAALGDTIAPGDIRYYQTYYRDGNATFCPSPTGSTFNISNGLKIVWY